MSYNGLDDRFKIMTGDFREQKFETKYDLVTGSPPYFATTDGPTPEHPQKLACRFELRGTIDAYVETARRALSPGGWFVCVFPTDPPHQKRRVFEAAQAHEMHVVRFRNVALQEGRDHHIGLFAMVRREDVPKLETIEEPMLIVRGEDGNVSNEYLALKLSFGFPPTQ